MSQWQRIRLPVQEMQVQYLGQEDLLEKEMATHSGTLAWRIPWTEEPGGLQSTRSDMTAMEHAHLKKKKKEGRRKGEKEDRKKADRKKERKEERREEGQEERKKMVNLGQYLWALTFQTRCYTDIKIHTMLDIMHLHFTLKEN